MKLCIFGGVGSGKSVALHYLEKAYGAEIIGMDETAHQLYLPGEKGWEAARELLGDEIVNTDGSLDRRRMADILYADPARMEALNAVVHPMVYEAVDRRLNESSAAVVVVETALPKKERSDKYDELWYVYTPQEVRKKRLMRDRGYTEERAEEIMRKQKSDQDYQAIADWVLENSGTREELQMRIDRRLLGKAVKITEPDRP